MSEEKELINVYGARVHNLKDIDVEIPRNSLTVITGLSGSGKSSLAFDTIFAEGQRRYIETFSAYARNFLGGLERRMWIRLQDSAGNFHRTENDEQESPLYRGDYDRDIRLSPFALCPCRSCLFLSFGRENGEIYRGTDHRPDSPGLSG